jgi:uncharacterized membrane protein YhaH (DUF805 family)
MQRFFYVWFDLNGRIDRRTWLAFAIMLAVLEYITELAIRRAFHLPPPAAGSGSPFLSAYLGDEVSLLGELIFLWPSLAIDIKRWHDIGRSGWYTLIVYAPGLLLLVLGAAGAGGTASHPDPGISTFLSIFGVILLAYFIILAARKGAPVANRFGPAPS